MERQMELIRTLETHYKQLADRTAKDQAKAKQEMNELQRENQELRRELAELKADVQGMNAENYKKQDRPRQQRDFGDYDPMNIFENRDIVFRTDTGHRQPSTPQRRPPYSPKHANRSTRKGRGQQDQDSPQRRAHFSSNQVCRSLEKPKDREAAAVSQWEQRYQDQGARHYYGPMKSVSYASVTGSSFTRTEPPRARRSLVQA